MNNRLGLQVHKYKHMLIEKSPLSRIGFVIGLKQM